jgi:integrase/recombinase XerD
VDSYRINLKYWQKYLAGQGVGELSAITPQIAAGFQAWIYNYRTHFRRPFTLQSQIAILNNIQVFYHYLFNTGKILSNPAEVIRLPKKPRQLPSVILKPHEMKRLLAQPDTSTVLGFRDRTMYEVLYTTGIRIGELTRLRVQDLALSEGTIFIHQGKGEKDRVVPVGATACRYLAEYVKRIRPMFRQASATDVLFFNKAGRPQQKAGIWRKLKLYAMRAGIEKRVTVHTFRHTLATEMLKGGADIRQIQELLGHGNLRTTQIYTHIVKGDLRRVQAQCHPREQTELPENFVNYRGRKYLTDEERKETSHPRKRKASDET